MEFDVDRVAVRCYLEHAIQTRLEEGRDYQGQDGYYRAIADMAACFEAFLNDPHTYPHSDFQERDEDLAYATVSLQILAELSEPAD